MEKCSLLEEQPKEVSQSIDLNSILVYKVLQKKGVTHFHHANTVTTSKSFVRQKALLSRERMEAESLQITSQKSDSVDKNEGINDFIFMDGFDLAEYFSFMRPNVYGPILFKFSIDILLLPSIPTLRISKTNPLYWKKSMSLNDKYFMTIEEFENTYRVGNRYRDANICFMFTTLKGKLPFSMGLGEIKVDNPGDNVKNSNGDKVFEIVLTYLFENIKVYKRENPNIKLSQRLQFQTHYEEMKKHDSEKFLKFFRRGS